MIRYAVLPYCVGSKSAKTLANTLRERGKKVIRAKVKNSRFKARKGDTVINMGSRNEHHPALEMLYYPNENLILNRSPICKEDLYFDWSYKSNIDIKLELVTATDDKEEALEWVEKGKVLGRQTLNGHSGKGIYVYDTKEELEECNLPMKAYTKYQKSSCEYRVHFFNDIEGTRFLVQQKRKRSGAEKNNVVRNYGTGWIYSVNNVDEHGIKLAESEDLELFARELPQDFGAMDILYSKREDKYVILEVNSCPGLESPTVIGFYVDNIIAYSQEYKAWLKTK